MQGNKLEDIYKNNLCTGCGTCVGICPRDALSLVIEEKKGVLIPRLNHEFCSQCGLCYSVCPGKNLNIPELSLKLFEGEKYNPLLGSFNTSYLGYSTDLEIRYRTTSGGMITQLLIFALEADLINGALITTINEDNPLHPMGFIARTREEIIQGSGSKYCPVPVNILLKEIIKSNKEEKFAVVGLPCHIHGIRKAELVNKKLCNKIVLHLGLFCNHTPNFLGTEFLLSQNGINIENVRKIDYRGRGWPGILQVELHEGEPVSIPYDVYWKNGFGSYFFPYRCTLCGDGTSELADISFGDAWLPKLSSNTIGFSIIIGRNKIGIDLLKNAEKSGKIFLDELTEESVIQSQDSMLKFKKKQIMARMALLHFLGKSLPEYGNEFESLEFHDIISAILLYTRLKIASKRTLWKILPAYLKIEKFWLEKALKLFQF